MARPPLRPFLLPRRPSALAGLALSLTLLGVSAASCGSSRTPADAEDGGGGGGPVFPDGGGELATCKGGKMCVANAIHECDAQGKPGAKVGECNGKTEVCIGGECQKGCAAADLLTSNVGCEFWAVDLDQENDGSNNAAAAPWGLVLSNAGDAPAEVFVEQNDAAPGAPPKIGLFKRVVIAPGTLETIEMPAREVDGSTQGKNEGPGTMLSSNAFRVTSTQPIIAYQFNALRSQYSNDASLLLPTGSLGSVYRVLSWPSGKPISIFGSPIDRGYVTVVGTRAGTQVSVTVANAIVAGGSVPATAKGGVVTATLGPFDVLNLETDGMPGDMTGTVVTSSAPVAVFTGTELSGAPGAKKPPAPTDPSSQCCLDHLEEQLFPVESYGRKFVIPRSPLRSSGSKYTDYDILRFMGVASAATVKTNLPPPDDSFTLNPGEVRETFTDKDFVADASEPIAVAQILVSQEYTENVLGDPSLTIFPAIDQFREDYLFLVPGSWTKNYVAIAMPEGTTVTIDGAPPAGCVTATAGALEGKTYVALRCPLTEGVHKLKGDKPYGIVAYGYGRAGSYAFVGGANVKKIYTPPPIR
ncbi:MAG TPA: IgGFc-binding protein [Polyangiaceae bacterium]|nr:IgGFc-binding protein [Polyangiaceae bacterium]